jgi:hypothetical protein
MGSQFSIMNYDFVMLYSGGPWYAIGIGIVGIKITTPEYWFR